MNDNEKDLFDVNKLIVETQPQAEIQMINEDALIENIGATGEISENNPVNKVDMNTEKVSVKNLDNQDEEILFGSYEVKNWDFSPRIYKIIGGATIINLLMLLVVAQTNMLATSACDSPFVNRVCQVLDTVYVGSKLFNGNNELGDEEYVPTVLNDTEVVWHDTTNLEPKITYPVGYFQIANRDEIAAELALLENLGDQSPYNNPTNPTYTPPPFTPKLNTPNSSGSGSKSSSRGFGSSRKNRSGGGLLSTKANPPKTRKDPVKGDVDTSIVQYEDDEDPKNGGETTADKTNDKPPTEKNPIADKTAKESDKVESEYNTKPLTDFLGKFLEKRAENEVEIKKSFSIKLKGQLTKEGRFDREKTAFVDGQGEPEIIKIAQEAIMALGDSKFLKSLTDVDVKNIELSVVQNGDKFEVLIVSSLPTPEKARTAASGFGGILTVAKLQKRSRIEGIKNPKDAEKKLGEIDQLTLLQETKFTNQDKNFILKISLPRDKVQEMIKRSIEYEANKRKNESKEPNGTATTKNSDDVKAK